jgi:glycerol kinase
MAEAADARQDVILVPAFVGLGAPHWDTEARGALFGLTRDTGPNELARAALESVCFQTLDLLEAMRADWRGSGASDESNDGDGGGSGGSNSSNSNIGSGGFAGTVLRVDGGMVASDWTMQRLADILGAPVDRPTILETTALGAAYLAGLQSGLYPDPQAFTKRWALDRRFTAGMDGAVRQRKIAAWRDAVRRTLSVAPSLPSPAKREM